MFGKDDQVLALSAMLYFTQSFILSHLMHLTHQGTYMTAGLLGQTTVHFYLYHLFFTQIVWGSKISLFFLYRRLLAGLYMKGRLRITGVLLALSWSFVTLLALVPLRPFGAGDPLDKSAYTPFETVHAEMTKHLVGALDVLTSLVLAVLPFALLQRLQLNSGDKTALSVVFSLGLLSMVAAALRWAMLMDMRSANNCILWTNLEQSCLLVVQSLMVLRPLLYSALQCLGFHPQSRRATVHSSLSIQMAPPWTTESVPFPTTKSPGVDRPFESLESLDNHAHIRQRSRDLTESHLDPDLCSYASTTLNSQSSYSKIVKTREEEANAVDHDQHPNVMAIPWPGIQVEQTFSHTYHSRSRTDLPQFSRTEIFGGHGGARPKHPVKSKSLTSIARQKEPFCKLRTAATFSDLHHSAAPVVVSDMPDMPTLKLVP